MITNFITDSEKPELVITREFRAPRELVFQLWTEPEHLKQWWGPTGFDLGVSQLDLRPGGIFHYSMKSPDGFEMWAKFVYREIEAPERIVYVNSFSDPEGNTIRAPFEGHETWPLETLYTLTLSESDGITTVTLRGEPIHATEEERRTYAAGFDSMKQGFSGTFDQLADYLARVL